MSVQGNHTVWTGYTSAGVSISVGHCVCLIAAGTRYTVASTANLALQSLGTVGIAITASDDTNNSFELQFCGLVPSSITGLGAGAAGLIYVSTTGVLSRTTNGASVGTCDTSGNAIVTFASGGVSAISLPFNVASPSPQDFGQGEQYISYGAGGSTLPTLSSTVGSLINLSNTIGSSAGDRYGVISWRHPGGGDARILSVAYNSPSPFLFIGDTSIVQLSVTSSFMGFIGGEDSLFVGLSPAANDYSGLLTNRRLAIGTSGTSNHASFGGATAGPMIKLHKLATAPTGNPVGNPDNPALWIYFTEGGSDFLDVHFPSGNVCRIPDANVTLPTSAGVSFSDSAGLRGLLSDETGSGAAMFGTGPTCTGLIVSDFTSIGGGTVHASAKIRLAYNGGSSRVILGTRTSAAADVSLISDGAGDTWLIGNTSMDFQINQAVGNIFCTSNFTIASGSTNALVTTGSKFGIVQPVSGSSGDSKPLQFKRTALTITGNKTLSAAEYENVFIDLDGSPGGAFDVVCPDLAGATFNFKNNSGQTATIKKSGGTGFTIANGAVAWAHHDGTDYESRAA